MLSRVIPYLHHSSMLPPSRVLIIRINFAQMIYSRIMQCSQSGIHGLNPTAS